MIRPVSKRLLPALALAFVLLVPALGLADPVVRVSVAAPHDLDTLLGDLAKAGEKPDKADAPRKLLTQMHLYEDNGIDTTKRIGSVVILKEGAPPAVWLLIPVKDEKQYLSALKVFYPTQEALKDGRTKLVGDKGPPMTAHIDKGWAYVTTFAEPEPPLPADPEKLTAGTGTIDVTISVASIPDAQKKMMVDQARANAQAKEAQMPEDQRAKAHAGSEAFCAALEKFFTNTDTVLISLTLSAKEFRLDFELHNKAGVPAAKASDLAPLGLARLVPETSALGVTCDMSLDEMARQAMAESSKAAFREAHKPGDPEAKTKFLDAVEAEAQNVLKSGRVEGIAMFSGKKGDAAMIATVRTSTDSKLADAFKSMYEGVMKKPDVKNKPTVKTEGDTTIYTVDVPQSEKSADIGGHEMGLGVKPGLVTLVFGGKTADKIKEHFAALAGNNKPADNGLGSTRGWWGVRAFADIFGVDTFAKTKDDADLFTKLVTVGADQVGFQLEPQKDGYKSGLYVQSGLVSLLCHFMVKDPAGAPAPGAPAPDASGGGAQQMGPGDSTPARTESPAPAAAPSAAPSAEASPAAEGDKKEEEEKPAKKEGGEEGGDK